MAMRRCSRSVRRGPRRRPIARSAFAPRSSLSTASSIITTCGGSGEGRSSFRHRGSASHHDRRRARACAGADRRRQPVAVAIECLRRRGTGRARDARLAESARRAETIDAGSARLEQSASVSHADTRSSPGCTRECTTEMTQRSRGASTAGTFGRSPDRCCTAGARTRRAMRSRGSRSRRGSSSTIGCLPHATARLARAGRGRSGASIPQIASADVDSIRRLILRIRA